MKMRRGFITQQLPCPVCGKITGIGAFISRGSGFVLVCSYCSKKDPQTIMQAINHRAAQGLPVTIEQHRKGGTMNGYQILSEQHRKAGQERQADLYAFLATCKQEDICNLFNSSAFNEICKGYLQLALSERIEQGTITGEQAEAIKASFAYLIEEKRAQEAL